MPIACWKSCFRTCFWLSTRCFWRVLLSLLCPNIIDWGKWRVLLYLSSFTSPDISQLAIWEFLRILQHQALYMVIQCIKFNEVLARGMSLHGFTVGVIKRFGHPSLWAFAQASGTPTPCERAVKIILSLATPFIFMSWAEKRPVRQLFQIEKTPSRMWFKKHDLSVMSSKTNWGKRDNFIDEPSFLWLANGHHIFLLNSFCREMQFHWCVKCFSQWCQFFLSCGMESLFPN